jgi:hypothetical protein
MAFRLTQASPDGFVVIEQAVKLLSWLCVRHRRASAFAVVCPDTDWSGRDPTQPEI